MNTILLIVALVLAIIHLAKAGAKSELGWAVLVLIVLQLLPLAGGLR